MVEFVKYTGKYPCLCLGVLTLLIDGEKFSVENALYSTGNVAFSENWQNPTIAKGPWTIDVKKLPDKYKGLAEEIGECVNRHVPFGCCGGCI